jgi:C4-dicarboxylate-specific signal transduction histidine kinase
MIETNLSACLSENINAVRALAGLKAIRQALVKKDKASLAEADTILDHFQNSLPAEVCYLMDSQGNTVASSNRHDKDSFAGKNFSFRPYFQQAIQGKLATYLALGTTSERRGAYSSYPVLAWNRRTPVGVAVIKTSIDFIEEKLATTEDEIVLVTDPQGIIFVSSRRDWLFHALSPLSPEEAAHIAETQQFGKGPWAWTGLTLSGQNFAVDADGQRYQMRQLPLDNYPGWRVIYLQGPRSVAGIIADPLLTTTGYVIFLLCELMDWEVFFLY